MALPGYNLKRWPRLRAALYHKADRFLRKGLVFRDTSRSASTLSKGVFAKQKSCYKANKFCCRRPTVQAQVGGPRVLLQGHGIVQDGHDDHQTDQDEVGCVTGRWSWSTSAGTLCFSGWPWCTQNWLGGRGECFKTHYRLSELNRDRSVDLA